MTSAVRSRCLLVRRLRLWAMTQNNLGNALQTLGSVNALKHGARSAEALALKREIQALARMARETMASIE